MPKVYNKYKHDCPHDAIYVGRPSNWGNPFRIGRDGTREEVIRKFRGYILNNAKLLAALPELRGRDLICYCSPLPCHADILLELANKETGEKE